MGDGSSVLSNKTYTHNEEINIQISMTDGIGEIYEIINKIPVLLNLGIITGPLIPVVYFYSTLAKVSINPILEFVK